ncbi:MAG: molybdenum cofactor biosynthesis protein MoaE [Verrucomicrobia bacterium]|nr:molybdenum cofactor biosynthesis protein MoaE [Verrucomicrobiota bacterium]
MLTDKTMFSLSDQPIVADALREALYNPAAGALVVFEGRVRNENEGKPVRSLEYEAYADMATREGNQLLDEARQRFGALDIRCVHRVGRLQVGELAVWVGVSAAHRDAAFRACRYVIDELKRRLPIWKKEFYADGNAHWIADGTMSAGQYRKPSRTTRP